MEPDQRNSFCGVEPLRGREPNADLITHLERVLEQAKAGEIIGVACVSMHADMTASQLVAGKVGGSIMIGQARVMEHDLMTVTMAARDHLE